FVCDQVKIPLPVARLDVLKPVPFFGKWPQRFAQDFEGMHFQRRLAGFGEETNPLDADEIAKIDQLKQIDYLVADFFRVDVNLDSPRRIAQVDEVAFTHVAVRGDVAGRAQGGS